MRRAGLRHRDNEMPDLKTGSPVVGLLNNWRLEQDTAMRMKCNDVDVPGRGLLIDCVGDWFD